jgi:osmotically-inducible protein OsmY
MNSSALKRVLTFFGGLGLGAFTMYLLDPDRGSRRRAMAGDQLLHGFRVTRNTLDAKSKDLAHRARGWAIETRAAFREEPPSDEVIVARVRATLGHFASHPHSIEVASNDALITVSGRVPKDEVGPIISCISKVRGVRGVENRLSPETRSA